MLELVGLVVCICLEVACFGWWLCLLTCYLVIGWFWGVGFNACFVCVLRLLGWFCYFV